MAEHIMIVDDDENLCESIADGLRAHGFVVTMEHSVPSALATLQRGRVDAVVTDLKLGEADGLEFCRQLARHDPDIPCIVITGFGDLQSAIGAMRAGAIDFLPKPFAIEHLCVSLERAFQKRGLKQELSDLKQVPLGAGRKHDMAGDSPSMRRVYDILQRVAPTDATVLIIGESGTGKELIARALHERSPRAEGPFIAVNCAAMPATLLESELFGHVKGAFTDARQARKGLFLEASGGTLLLDEIAEMPAEMQAKLLRALQERTVRPVGGSSEVPFDVRIVAATNRDLESEVAQGAFREDLFYRINVVRILSPPLRQRGNDILLLAQRFLHRAAERNHKAVAGISLSAAQKLLSYEWPGNVRELQNCMEQAVALTRFQEIVVEDLPDKVTRFHPESVPTMIEIRYILQVLRAVGGNKTAAARVLGFDRRTLYRKLEKMEREQAPQKRAS
jgi:DNA-binding NtrC family response regulator